MSSCMNFPAGTTLGQKRERCRPGGLPLPLRDVKWALGHAIKDAIYGCHELEIHPDDRLTCGVGRGAARVRHEGRLRRPRHARRLHRRQAARAARCRAARATRAPPGPPRPARRSPTASTGPATASPTSTVPGWIAVGRPSLEGVRYLGSVHHQGRAATGEANPPTTSLQDIDFDHEAELSQSKELLLATDERGGGVAPPGATCSPGADIAVGNGGLHAYRAGALRTNGPGTPRSPSRPTPRTPRAARPSTAPRSGPQPQGSICTAHVFQQIPGQNRDLHGLVLAGHPGRRLHRERRRDGRLQGGRLLHPGGRQHVGVARVQGGAQPRRLLQLLRRDGRLQPRRRRRRNAIDVYKVRLPAPPIPKGGIRPGRRTTRSRTRRAPPRASRASASARASAKPRGRGLAFAFTRRTRNPVKVDVFRTTRGRRVTGERRVARVRPQGALVPLERPRPAACATATTSCASRCGRRTGRPTSAASRCAARGGRFRSLPRYFRGKQCALVQTFKLERPVFGGTKRRTLGIAFRLGRAARVTVTVTRKGKIVKRFKRKALQRRAHLPPEARRQGPQARDLPGDAARPAARARSRPRRSSRASSKAKGPAVCTARDAATASRA